MGNIISAVSGKGGTGKTTSVANIGIAMASMGHEVLIIDLDLGLRNMDLALGLQNEVNFDVLDVVRENCTFREAIIQTEQYKNLSFIPASQFKEENSLSQEEMRLLLDMIKDRFDYILLDCPAGMGTVVSTAVAVSDIVLIVVNHDPFSLRDGDRIAGLVSNISDAQLKLMVNRYKIDLVQQGKMPNILEVIENMAVQLVGAIPDDDSVLLSGISGVPLVAVASSDIAQKYINAARRLLGEHIPLLDVEPKKRGFFKHKRK